MYKKAAKVNLKMGLHARPAAEFVKIAGGFKSDIYITSRGKTVNGKSILGVLSAGANCGDDIVISAEGEDEADAVAALVLLVSGDGSK